MNEKSGGVYCLQMMYVPKIVVYLIGFSCMLNGIWFNNIDNQLAVKDAAAIDKF